MMTKSLMKAVSRRRLLQGVGGLAVVGAGLSMPVVRTRAADPLKVGLMLPYSGHLHGAR